MSRLLTRLSLLLFTVGLLVAVHAAEAWGPVVAAVSPTAVQLRWRDGDVPATGVTLNGQAYAGTPIDGGFRAVSVDKLKPNTEYAYTFTHDGKTDRYTVRTAVQGATPFTFAAYGDCRTGHEIHAKVVKAILDLKPRFVLNSGDLVAAGTQEADWTKFFSIATPLTASAPYFPVPGNHEQNASTFFKLFPGTLDANPGYYTFVYGSVRVIMLDSTQKIPEQRDWLEKTLAAAQQTPTPWTVAVFHYPPFTSSPRGANDAVKQQWVPLFEKYHVDAVFLGHDHFYERSEVNGVQYLIIGGGGAPLYPQKEGSNPYQKVFKQANHYMTVDVTPTEMRLRMFLLDGTVGDEVTLKKAEKP